MGELARSLAFMMNDPDNAGEFLMICGIKTHSFEVTANMIETTVPDCTDRSAPLHKTTRYGKKELSIEGEGLFQDHAAVKLAVAAFEAQTPLDGKIVVPGLGTYACAAGWNITKLSFGGDMEEDLSMTIGFMPAGKYVFTAE